MFISLCRNLKNEHYYHQRNCELLVGFEKKCDKKNVTYLT